VRRSEGERVGRWKAQRVRRPEGERVGSWEDERVRRWENSDKKVRRYEGGKVGGELEGQGPATL
jgi:hypothetical protein